VPQKAPVVGTTKAPSANPHTHVVSQMETTDLQIQRTGRTIFQPSWQTPSTYEHFQCTKECILLNNDASLNYLEGSAAL